MPFFNKKDKNTRQEDGSPPPDPTTKTEEKVKQIQEENRAQQMAKQLSFNCQLAHGSPTAKVTNFSNVKELYSRIAEALKVPVTNVSI